MGHEVITGCGTVSLHLYFLRRQRTLSPFNFVIMSSDTTQSTSRDTHAEDQSSVFTRIRNAVSKPAADPGPPNGSELSGGEGDETQGERGPVQANKPTVLERFMSTMSLRPRDSDIEFPPPHWRTDEGTSISSPEGSSAPGISGESNTLDGADHNAYDSPEFEDNIPPTQAPEPESFANRIHGMIAALPPIFSSTPASTTAASGDPLAPNMIKDPKMISFLSSPSVMNGSASSGRQSVWNVLDRLKGRLPAPMVSEEAGTEGVPLDSVGGEGFREQNDETDDDDSSVMLYGPLLPGADSQVELAESEMVRGDEGVSSDEQERREGKSPGVWPFSGGNGKSSEEQKGGKRVHLRDSKNRRVWVPSDSKISLEIMWWGYRLYLPPPVLDMLNNKKLEGTKRAAMITTALKWLLDRVPVLMIPPNMRPAIKLLKGLVPYLGYVGGFVAWSWGYIKKFDKGNGVTLTATWLATLALVPGTWEDSALPKGTSANAPLKATAQGERGSPSSSPDIMTSESAGHSPSSPGA